MQGYLGFLKGSKLFRVMMLLTLLFCSFRSFSQAGVNMSSPIFMSSYGGGNFTYTDSRNNSTYGNDYGQSSPDVYYKFTVAGSTQLSLSLCGSSFDTYLYLLDASGNLVTSNDDNGPLCSGTASSISNTIAAGTYYIVVEGYGSNTGNYNINVTLNVTAPQATAGVNMGNAIVIGNFTTGGTYTYTDNRSNDPTNGYQNDYGQASDDIYYKVSFNSTATLNVSTCGSGFDTYLHLLRSDGTLVQSNDDNGPLCSGAQASIQTISLAAGTYYIVAEGYSSNSGMINLSVTTTVQSPLVGGTISPVSQTIASGATAATLTATPATGGDGTAISYQWQKSTDNTTWSNISGATSLSCGPGVVAVKTWYRVAITQSAQVVYSSTAVVDVSGPPATTLSADQNYIASWVPIAPITDPAAVVSRSADDVRLQVQYFDGLGRPLQTVVRNGSLETATGTKKDLVVPVTYDAFGRQDKTYLPYAATGASGSYRVDALTSQLSFYQGKYSSQNEAGYFYSQTVFEASPLNRVMEQFAPGQSWGGTITQANEQNRHSIKNKYWINTAKDSVGIWDVTDSADITSYGSYSCTRTYQAGELYKNVSVDEHGKQVIEFKDKDGQTVLKKVQLTAVADDGTGSGQTGWMCTYYIYDNLNQLRCVIQPEAIRAMTATLNPTLTTTMLAEQCFRYKYDERQRMIKKQVPGAADVYLVYDARDRLILTQDGNMRPSGQWLYTQYDNLNRPVATGKWVISNTTTYSFANIRVAAYGSTGYTDSLSGKGTIEELTTTFYDNYSWVTAPAYSGSVPSTFGNYDNSWDSYLLVADNNNFPYPQANIKDNRTTGMVTGTRIKVMDGGTTYIYTINIYDAKARIIQAKSINFTSGIDVTTTQYSWSGQPLTVVSKQQKGVTGAIYTDALGRVTQTKKRIIGGSADSGEKVIALNKYDEQGQLKEKALAPTGGPGGGVLESQKYEYNVRGWLLGMNRDYVNSAATGSYFGFDLAYDKTNNSNYSGANPTNTSLNGYAGAGQFNGNITGMTWRGSNGGKELRRYNFSYDAANRIMKADFGQWNGSSYAVGSTGVSGSKKYDMQMGDGTDPATAYDFNGNIKKMVQYGYQPTISQSIKIDDLTYNYKNSEGSNKLAKIADAVTTNNNLGDFTDLNTTGDDYDYDYNGNLTKDLNKNISNISYNFLNLPNVITVIGKGTITYTYDAVGNKLTKKVNEGASQKVTNYVGSMIYEGSNGDVLSLIGMEEGRMRLTAPTGGSWVYDYMLKDHLGNVRVMVAEGGTLLEESAYYPFGLTMAGISFKAAGSLINKNKFGGKELQSLEFTDGSGLELYDFGARDQDPQIGRWTTMDSKAEKYFSSSPYNYVDNNPISRIDPTGKDWFYYQAEGETKKSWHYQKGHKATYTNNKGKEVTTKRGFETLVTFKATGTNSEGAKTGTITVYNQDKVVATVATSFTGGVGGTNPTLPGNYMMNLSARDPKGPQKMNAAQDNPDPAWGIQKIVNRFINASGVGTNNTSGFDIQGAYGKGRIRLMETDGDLNITTKQTHGYYLHGKLDAHNITHGCVCDKSEAIFNYFWSGGGKDVRGKIPFSVE